MMTFLQIGQTGHVVSNARILLLKTKRHPHGRMMLIRFNQATLPTRIAAA